MDGVQKRREIVSSKPYGEEFLTYGVRKPNYPMVFRTLFACIRILLLLLLLLLLTRIELSLGGSSPYTSTYLLTYLLTYSME
jgi:hypothetical protein